MIPFIFGRTWIFLFMMLVPSIGEHSNLSCIISYNLWSDPCWSPNSHCGTKPYEHLDCAQPMPNSSEPAVENLPGPTFPNDLWVISVASPFSCTWIDWWHWRLVAGPFLALFFAMVIRFPDQNDGGHPTVGRKLSQGVGRRLPLQFGRRGPVIFHVNRFHDMI